MNKIQLTLPKLLRSLLLRTVSALSTILCLELIEVTCQMVNKRLNRFSRKTLMSKCITFYILSETYCTLHGFLILVG